MAWVKKPIDRMEMMHLLGLVYARTAPGFGKVALGKLIRDEARPTVRAKARCVLLALTQSGLLLYCKEKKNREYRWNMKEWGPVSLLVADAMIAETEAQIRRKGRMYYASRKKHEDEG